MADWITRDIASAAILSLEILSCWSNYSDLTRPGPPKGSYLEGKSPYFRISRLVKYDNLARCWPKNVLVQIKKVKVMLGPTETRDFQI